MTSEFRFQNLAIWQRAAQLVILLDEVASGIDAKKKFRFAEQLRAAALSISNNIAEVSGSNSDKDFIKFLYIARKSAFECASMLMIFQQQGYLSTDPEGLIAELEAVSRMIVAFARSIEAKSEERRARSEEQGAKSVKHRVDSKLSPCSLLPAPSTKIHSHVRNTTNCDRP